MVHVVGISGSLRTGSFNTRLLRAAIRLAPPHCTVVEADIRQIPLYDGDIEARDGVPLAVERLKERIIAADGVLLVSPEYNHSVPGVLKNAIDWLSRPAHDIARVFGGRPFAIMGASPGRGGTRSAQTAWLPVLHTLGAFTWAEQQLFVAGARHVFVGDRVEDDAIEERIRDFMDGFADFCAAHGRGRHPALV